MKKILLLATGGTIASIDTGEGLRPAASPGELLSYIPEASELCDLSVRELFSIDSTNMQPEHWLRLAREIEAAYDAYDGFLITHGTDTMAYTAAALSYLIQGAGKPIVLTGSQLPISYASSDARKNLMDSLRFCLAEGTRGVYLVFDGKAIIGTRARKVRSKSFSAFESINYPVAAFIDEHEIIRYVDSAADAGELRFYRKLKQNVVLLKLIPGLRPETLSYLGEHYDVIVIESYGAGGIPFYGHSDFLSELEKLTSRGKVIVIATQVMLEGSDAGRYEVGARAMKNYNVLQSYDMTIEAVCTKLMWAGAAARDFDELRRLFYSRVGSDILYGAREREAWQRSDQEAHPKNRL